MSMEGQASAEVSSKKRKRSSSRSLQENAEEPFEELKKPSRRGTWKNLDFILSLQDREIPADRKIESAFNFIGSNFCGEGSKSEPLQAARVISFLTEWVQPVLISSDACFDYRLWIVLKFCLQKSATSPSHNLLRPISRAVIHASIILDEDDEPREGEDSFRFLDAFSECVSLLFSSYGRSFNSAGMELWISCAAAAVGFILKLSPSGRFSFSSKDKLLPQMVLLLDHFANFLRFHPSPKSIFRSFVDRLLEPLVELLALLHTNGDHGDHEQGGSLLNVVENSLCNGLCHPSHINGFAALRNSSLKTEVQERRNLNESYHRHLFKKLQDIVDGKKVGSIGGFGHLLQLFVNSLMNKQRVSASIKTTLKSEKEQRLPDQNIGSRRTLFEVLIQFMDPLLLECRKFMEIDLLTSEESVATRMMGFLTIVRTINDILEVTVRNKVYDRTQDSPEGDQCNFLKRVYEAIVIVCKKLYFLWPSVQSVCETSSSENFGLIAKELVVSIGYFLDIEYNVVGNDLTGIWLMILSYLAISEHHDVKSNDSLFRSKILSIGCQMIMTYSDLRQASKPIFALCEAMRSFKYYDNEKESDQLTIFSFGCISPDAFSRAVATLVCSKDIKSAISNAIKSIPEGQAGECIHQLKSDFTEALCWLRTNLLSCCVQTEIFGLASEIYSVILESLVVTASNSVLVGNSVNVLMTTVSLPFETSMLNQSCDFDNFYVSFAGKSLSDRVSMVETSWIFLCVFRLLVSCRSLYMQVTSLAPSVWLKKSSSSVSKSFKVPSGKEWEKEESYTSEGYFSWIMSPSVSLVSMSRAFLEYSIGEEVPKVFPPLVYVMNVMGLQRLIDLNRQIRSLNFLVQRNKMLIRMQANSDLRQLPQKQNKRLKHLIKVSKEEASDLTSLMTEHLHSLEYNNAFRFCELSTGFREKAWNLGICSLNEGSLPIAIWQLLCQNIDVWSVHASRKSLKAFSSLLIHHWVNYYSNHKHSVEQDTYELSPKHITFYDISAEVLKDLVFYEQPVLLRHLTSRLSSTLKNLIHQLVSHAFGDNLDSGYLPDWSDILSCIDSWQISESYSAQSLWNSILSYSGSSDVSTGGRVFPSLKPEFYTSEGLLNLFCQLSLRIIDHKALSAIVGYSLHLERLLFSALMRSCEYSYLHYDLLKLFVCCRRTLKQVLVASCKDFSTDDLNLGCPSMIQWLLKSVSWVVGLSASHFGDKPTSEVNMMFFQLMDHTSNLFVTLGERKINLDSSGGHFDFWKNLTIVAATLATEIRTDVIFGKWNYISCILHCIQGFLWGLVSALEDFGKECLAENTPISECISELEKLVALFDEFLDSCMMSLLVSDDDHDDAAISMDGICVALKVHKKYHLRLPMLRSLLRGENTDISFIIRQIFMSAAAILRFRQLPLFQKTKKRGHFCDYLQSMSANVLLALSDFISSEMTDLFLWTDGMLKYLEVLGSCFPEGNSVSYDSLYPKMVNIHLRAMGKCISWRCKIRTSLNKRGNDTCIMSLGTNQLDELICRLRTSFKELIRKPLRSGFMLLVQKLVSVLVDIHKGDSDVAAGLDFLDLVVDSFSGDKVFGIIKVHARTLFASLFNIILHLQSPQIFYLEFSTFGQQEVDIDPGSTILSCVEILRKFSRKNTQLKMDSWSVGQSLHVPFSLFKHFRESSLRFKKDLGHCIIDSQYSVELYAACCRLLCTVIRHQKSETAQCIALLEDSVNALLKCLASLDNENAHQNGGQGVLNTKGALMCANYLRRVYEEMKQQKDTVGTYASHFLSDYLYICSGLKREVDEALRPGVYALVDMCSPGDFQKLHTILGEGQCRRTLATLRNDYRLYFQYQGKI